MTMKNYLETLEKRIVDQGCKDDAAKEIELVDRFVALVEEEKLVVSASFCLAKCICAVLGTNFGRDQGARDDSLRARSEEKTEGRRTETERVGSSSRN